MLKGVSKTMTLDTFAWWADAAIWRVQAAESLASRDRQVHEEALQRRQEAYSHSIMCSNTPLLTARRQ